MAQHDVGRHRHPLALACLVALQHTDTVDTAPHAGGDAQRKVGSGPLFDPQIVCLRPLNERLQWMRVKIGIDPGAGTQSGDDDFIGSHGIVRAKVKRLIGAPVQESIEADHPGIGIIPEFGIVRTLRHFRFEVVHAAIPLAALRL